MKEIKCKIHRESKQREGERESVLGETDTMNTCDSSHIHKTGASSETVSYTLTFSQTFLQVGGQLVVVHLLQDGQHYGPDSRAVRLHHQVHSVVCVGLLQLSLWDSALVQKGAPKPLELHPCELVQTVPQHFLQGCGHCGVWILVHYKLDVWGQARPCFKKARWKKATVKNIIEFSQ